MCSWRTSGISVATRPLLYFLFNQSLGLRDDVPRAAKRGPESEEARNSVQDSSVGSHLDCVGGSWGSHGVAAFCEALPDSRGGWSKEYAGGAGEALPRKWTGPT